VPDAGRHGRGDAWKKEKEEAIQWVHKWRAPYRPPGLGVDGGDLEAFHFRGPNRESV